jgi:saccharopine dehydrogenase-like NADP-dependent oxidoreductase
LVLVVKLHTDTERPGMLLKMDSNIKTVLLFGSGRVSAPIAKFFALKENVHLIIATEDAKQAEGLMQWMPERSSFVSFHFPEDLVRLPELIGSCDIVIGLLPATMHIPIAEEVIKQRRHMVTASYVCVK